jgi:pyruvate formate lyase activating enzyme
MVEQILKERELWMATVKPKKVIAGIEDITTIDWIDHISMSIFFQGCSFNCGFCHNPELIPHIEGKLSLVDVQNQMDIAKDTGIIDSIIMTGGEPMCFPDEVMKLAIYAKSLGFDVMLNTNGFAYSAIERIVPALDYIAMDIKTSLDPQRYSEITDTITNSDILIHNIIETLGINIPKEVRTTVIPEVTTIKDIWKIARSIEEQCDRYILQQFEYEHANKPEYRKMSKPSIAMLEEYANIAREEFSRPIYIRSSEGLRRVY